jgi:hypothetical protein
VGQDKELIAEIETYLNDIETRFHWGKVHGGSSYICDICGSQNQRVGGIKAHIRDVHASQGWFRCVCCGQLVSKGEVHVCSGKG